MASQDTTFASKSTDQTPCKLHIGRDGADARRPAPETQVKTQAKTQVKTPAKTLPVPGRELPAAPLVFSDWASI